MKNPGLPSVSFHKHHSLGRAQDDYVPKRPSHTFGDEKYSSIVPLSFRLSTVLIATLSTAACVYPYVSYTNQETMAAGANIHDPPITDIASAAQLINGLATELQEARLHRNVARTVLAEVIFYGSLLAVYGITAEKAGARNVGAGLAGVSAALDSHYGLAAQQLAISNASSRASCLQDAINGIDSATLALFDGKYRGDLGSDEANKALQAIPDETLAAVQQIGNQLTNDLNAVNMTATSLAEVQDIADKFSKAADDAKKLKVPGPSKRVQANIESAPISDEDARREALEIQRKTTFLQRVVKFSAASQACVRLAVKAG